MQQSYSLVVNRIRDFYIDFLGIDEENIQDKSDEELLQNLNPTQLLDFVHF